MTRGTQFADSPGVDSAARIEYAVFGSGDPVTLFMHGLGGGIDDTRPLGIGVGGTQVYLHARSHGDSSDATPGVTFDDLAADAWRVVEATGATRAFGISLGTAVLLRMLSQRPDAFDRLGFYLPAAIDRPLARAAKLDILRSGAPEEQIEAEIVADIEKDLPADRRERPDAQAWNRTRARRLMRPGIAELLEMFAVEAPIADRESLRAVTAPCVVLGAEGDPTHDAAVARALGAVLPNAHLTVFPEAGPLWTARAQLRAAIAEVMGR